MKAGSYPVLAAAVLTCTSVQAQAAGSSVTVTLPEAVELGMRRAYTLRQAQLDSEDAAQQVRGAWSDVMPRLDGRIRYTRNVLAADPFAGTQAGDTFSTLDSVQWLRFNETARTDGDPATNPITFEAFEAAAAGALDDLGLAVDPNANPFLVENQFEFGLTLTQVLYDGSVFSGLKGTKVFKRIAERGADAEALRTFRQVSEAFYDALLAREQVRILAESAQRARANLEDTEIRVEQGVLPELQRLTARVELANRETALQRAENESRRALDRLQEQIGLPEDQSIAVRGDLDVATAPFELPTDDGAVTHALDTRPEVEQAEASLELARIEQSVQRARYLPRLDLVANLSGNGAVPDDRSFAVSAEDPNDPFALRVESNGFFDEAYWFPVFNVGLRLEWNLFNGFDTASEIRRRKIAFQRSEIDLERINLRVRLDVEQSLRELETTRQQIETQLQVRELAGESYRQVEVRVLQGTATQFDLRQASQQLDESRFNHLQAVHDHLVARIQYLAAVGLGPHR